MLLRGTNDQYAGVPKSCDGGYMRERSWFKVIQNSHVIYATKRVNSFAIFLLSLFHCRHNLCQVNRQFFRRTSWWSRYDVFVLWHMIYCFFHIQVINTRWISSIYSWCTCQMTYFYDNTYYLLQDFEETPIIWEYK
jgi:hypothetical protein